MNILAIDQARKGAWCVYDYEGKTPVAYGVFDFPSTQFTYAETLVGICDLVKQVIDQHDVSAVFIEDIQLRKNVSSFKRLAQLQGALVCMFEKNDYLYDYVPPSRWQNYCGARGRTSKELKHKVTKLPEDDDRKQTKILSIQAAKDLYGIDTADDNLADSIMIGHYIVNNVKIERKGISV